MSQQDFKQGHRHRFASSTAERAQEQLKHRSILSVRNIHDFRLYIQLLDMSKNSSSMSACAFDLVLSNAPCDIWSTRDVVSLLCVKPAAHIAGPLDLKVVLKSADCAGAFASWLTRHSRLLDSLQIKSERVWWPSWYAFEEYGHYGGVPAYRCVAAAAEQVPPQQQ
jgi:hypothetical protein